MRRDQGQEGGCEADARHGSSDEQAEYRGSADPWGTMAWHQKHQGSRSYLPLFLPIAPDQDASGQGRS